MRLDSAAVAGTDLAKTPNALLQIDARGAWADTLSIGQIIKGRVLRHYGEGKYEVGFSGERRVVDSSIPLAIGAQLKGRVVGLDEKVTIERIPEAGRSTTSANPIAPKATGRSTSDPALALAAALRIDMAPGDAKVIAAASARTTDASLAARMGLLLAKLGLPVSSRALHLVREFVDGGLPLTRRSVQRALSLGVEPGRVEVSEALPEAANTVARNRVAEWLERCSDGATEPELSESEDDAFFGPGGMPAESGEQGMSDQEREDDMFRRLIWALMNVQEGSAVSHRYQTLPVVVEGRLMEFDMALFEHAPKDEPGISTRRICFSLDTVFGAVSIDARIANERVSLSVASEDDAMSDALASTAAELTQRLNVLGWRVGESDFVTGRHLRPASAVVDHMLAHDSLFKVV